MYWTARILLSVMFAIFGLAILALVWDARSRRKKKDGESRTVILSAVYPALGIPVAAFFLFMGFLYTFAADLPELIFSWIPFYLLGLAQITAYFNCRITYNRDAFTVGRFFSGRRRYAYTDITEIRVGLFGKKLYMGRRRADVDGLYIGADEFLRFADERVQAAVGRPIPVIEKKKGKSGKGMP